ncbi:hypothetical protein RIMD111065_07550 [Aeromonas hydrophila]|nr:restriction endonuclease subunit S [Aeromonas hydrophila]BCO12399.1 hypothetical protein RIMD111065_07550 [Aeromonas hydrophila]
MSSEWARVRLKDVANIRNGAGIKQFFFADVGIPLARVTNFTDVSLDLKECVYVCPDHALKWNGHTLKEGDVLVATVGSWPPNWSSVVGKAVIVPLSASGALQNQNTSCVQAIDGVASQRFLYYVLRSVDFAFYAANSASGSANQARLPVAKLAEFEFNMPSLPEQTSIARILGALDDRIALLRDTNTTLETILQALFKSWFVDFDSVHARARGEQSAGLTPEVASLFPDSFEESELGMVPKGWTVGTLGDVVTIKGGKQLDKSLFDEQGANPIFGGAGIMGQTTFKNATGFVITVGRVGAYCGQFFWHIGDAWVNNNASHIIPVHIEQSVWVYQWLRAAKIDHIKKGAAQPFISNSDLAELKMVIPSDPVIDSFVDIASPIYEKMRLYQEQARSLSSLRDTLLPRLISGQLRLPDAKQQLKDLAV